MYNLGNAFSSSKTEISSIFFHLIVFRKHELSQGKLLSFDKFTDFEIFFNSKLLFLSSKLPA